MLRSGRPGIELLDLGSRRAADRNLPRLHRLRDFADQLDLHQSVFKRSALALYIGGEIELTPEGPRRDALIEELALLFLGLAAFDRQHILLGGDGDLVGRKARRR